MQCMYIIDGYYLRTQEAFKAAFKRIVTRELSYNVTGIAKFRDYMGKK
jgi:hypothetical protein